MIYALLLFLFIYILFLVFNNYKTYISLVGVLLFITFGFVPFDSIFDNIDFNVILMLFGMMGVVSLFIESKMPLVIADKIIKKCPNVKWMTVLLALFAGIVSAFVDNVATVLMIAPIVIVIAKELKISPVPIIFSVSIFSNIEGAATLVGDTTSILLAGEMNLNFFDFFLYDNRIGLFFIVQLGLIASLMVLYFLQRKNNKKIDSNINTKCENLYSSWLLILTIVTLIIFSFINVDFELINGVICCFYFVVGLIIKFIVKKDIKSIITTIKDIDYETLIFLVALFIIIGGINYMGVIDAIGDLFLRFGNDSPIVMYSLIVLISVIISAFIDNIPYVAMMLPVIASLNLSNPTMLYYGLIIGATLGGNFTPIGASSNVASIGILKKEGYSFKKGEYYKYSVPISIAAILTGYLIVLLMYN